MNGRTTLIALKKRLTLASLSLTATIFQAGCPLTLPDLSRDPAPIPTPVPDDTSSGRCVDPVVRGFPFLAEHCILPDGRTGFIEK